MQESCQVGYNRVRTFVEKPVAGKSDILVGMTVSFNAGVAFWAAFGRADFSDNYFY